MMAWPRIASLFLLVVIGACSTATDQTPVSVPLDTPPDYKQLIRTAIQADAVTKMPDKKPAAGTDAKADKKAAAGTDPKADKKSATGADAKSDSNSAIKNDKGVDSQRGLVRVTRIASKFGWSEISKPRAVHALAGWAWQVCLKGKNKSNAVYLAVFMQYNSIVDVRTGTEPDKCESETYEPL